MNATNKFTAILLSIALLTGCHPKSYLLEPCITFTPQRNHLAALPSDFPPLSPGELDQAWGKEMKIGIAMGHDLDLYRSITAFKRALILMPLDRIERIQQAEYSIILCYYLGGKYTEAICAFEESSLPQVSSKFVVFRDLMVILYDCYYQTCQPEKASTVMSIIQKGDPETAEELIVYTAFDDGNLAALSAFDKTSGFAAAYCCCKKSVQKAQTLNAILPGAGYFYVGQKKTALTSFVLNTAFIAAAYHFYSHGNWGAGLIATSFECGWYFGGINGAGLAAKEYNQSVYQNMAYDLAIFLQNHQAHLSLWN